MCLVFEKLGKSLYDLLSDNYYRGFYVEDIRVVAKQGLMALAFMRACRLTHTDLKALVLPAHHIFADFVGYLLQIDPRARPTPTEALKHPFFTRDLKD
ncbi:UNVERIFIED_CONTAM: hypothetical protein H355_002367 [Colinus virginianus]|nr:hypothetical protein H355_002367 [Colinus virginianus]